MCVPRQSRQNRQRAAQLEMGNAAMDDRIGVGSADIDAERQHEPHAVGPLDRGEAEALCDVAPVTS